jgi:hypothetical protein
MHSGRRSSIDPASLVPPPLGVVSGDVGEQAGWAAAQAKLAQLSSNSFHRTARGATHEVLLEERQFAAITSRAIADVIDGARTSSAA